MIEEYTAKTFKSGNLVALRLPKAIGLVEGEDVVLTSRADGSFSFWRARDAKQVFMSLYGSFSPAFMADRRADTEQQERDWSTPSRDVAS